MNEIILGKIIISILFFIFAVLVLWIGKLSMPISFSRNEEKKCKNLH